jgi:phage terminase large subunit-like protein
LNEWLPQDFVESSIKNQQGVVDTVQFKNGSRIRFMTYNQQPKEFEGFKAHWAWYDEPPTHGIYISNERSLIDYGGRSWFTLTPVRQPWIWTELVSKEGEDPTIEVFRMSIWDNCDENGGHLKREYIEYFLARLPTEERKSRETGEFLHLQGRVFSEWLPKRPFWVPYGDLAIKNYWPRVMAIDPHPRKPIAVIWCAISPDTDLWYAYRELYDPMLRTVQDVAEKIHELERGEVEDSRRVFRIIDPSSRENERTADSSVYEAFADYGIECELAQKSDRDGRRKKLREKLILDTVYNVPGLVTIAPPFGSPSNPDRSIGDGGCPRLRHEFLNYVWDEWEAATKDKHDPKQEPLKKDDDLLDGLMYLCQYGERARDFDPRFWSYKERGEAPSEKLQVVHPGRSRSRTGY